MQNLFAMTYIHTVQCNQTVLATTAVLSSTAIIFTKTTTAQYNLLSLTKFSEPVNPQAELCSTPLIHFTSHSSGNHFLSLDSLLSPAINSSCFHSWLFHHRLLFTSRLPSCIRTLTVSSVQLFFKLVLFRYYCDGSVRYFKPANRQLFSAC